MSCKAHHLLSYTMLYSINTHTHTHCWCSVAVVQAKAEQFYQCSRIVAFVSSVQSIQLPPLLSFIPHLHPCHSPFLPPPHVIRHHLHFSPLSTPSSPHLKWQRRLPLVQPIESEKWAANKRSGLTGSLLSMKQCNYSAVQIPAMYAYAMLSLILVPILHISTVHEYPSWIYGLFTTA